MTKKAVFKKVLATILVAAAGFAGAVGLILLFVKFDIMGFTVISNKGISTGIFLSFAPLIFAVRICVFNIWGSGGRRK